MGYGKRVIGARTRRRASRAERGRGQGQWGVIRRPSAGGASRRRRRVAFSGGAGREMLVLKGTTREDVVELARAIADEAPRHLPSAANARSYSAEVVTNVTNALAASGRYSPSVNAKLGLMKQDRVHDIFGCGDYMSAVNTQVPLVNIAPYLRGKSVDKGGKGGKKGKKCVYFTHPTAQKQMLDNLAAQREVNCGKVIAPVQAQANCWFNTMFVVFFVSDAGRRFFQYFRAMMILGVRGELAHMSGEGATLAAIERLHSGLASQPVHLKLPNDLHRPFFLLNYAIEACLTGNEAAYGLNTNVIILEIHNAIMKNWKADGRIRRSSVPKPGLDQLGDPYEYYVALMSYMSDNTIRFHEVAVHEDTDDDFDFAGEVLDDLRQFAPDEMPHVVYVELIQSKNKNIHASGARLPREMESTLPDGTKVRYELDAALLNEVTTNAHISCAITCNGEGFAYDGQSFTRLVPCDWKERLLNSQVDYKFETTPQCSYAFDRGHISLMYYRVR